MMLNREGRFRAQVVESGLSENKNGLASATIRFRITDEWDGDQWVDVSRENAEINTYMTLEKKDGSLNEVSIDMLKTGLGWDGVDLGYLNNGSAMPPCQIVAGYEEYNGQTRLKVKWINDYESTGASVRKADDQTLRSIATRLGSRLRANSGGTPVATPPKPKPAARPTPAKPKVTLDDVWEKFVAIHDDGDNATKEWGPFVAEHCANIESPTEAEMQAMITAIEAIDQIPFKV